jgi:hypothetical protein
MRFVIVGNALPSEDLSTQIDSADYVLRFNRMYRYGSGMVGSKIDFWCVCAHGAPVRDFIKPAGMQLLPIVSEAREIWFGSPADIPIPDAGRIVAQAPLILRDYKWEESGRPWYQVPEDTYLDLRETMRKAYREEAGESAGKFVPSTGMVGIHWALNWDRFADCDFEICCFDFFGGSSTIHAVPVEQAYVKTMIDLTKVQQVNGRQET